MQRLDSFISEECETQIMALVAGDLRGFDLLVFFYGLGMREKLRMGSSGNQLQGRELGITLSLVGVFG